MTDAWRDDYRSWGRLTTASHQVSQPRTLDDAADAVTTGGLPILAYGCGRSYGDVPLNPGGRLIDCRGLNRIVAFDAATGLLTCEAGVRLADILAEICRPDADGSGWMLPVTPGTRFVTVGGAIANDVHGKNHHRFGTFGAHVLSFELVRSHGARVTCSADQHPELFAATIGGLGLTGLILSAVIRMRRVPGLAVEAEDIRFDNLAGYFALAHASDAEWEYTAAWVDCLARGGSLGRGIFSRARHMPGRGAEPPARAPRRNLPFSPPISMVTQLSVRLFNAAYRRRLGARGRASHMGSYEKAFYPLDAVGGWNKVYGPRGFYQFQCVVPNDEAQGALTELLRMIAASGQGSPLSVLKLFGEKPSPGLLSFPAAGATLALDFANRGASTRELLTKLEHVVRLVGGRLYPAKDAFMHPDTFRRGYPELARFLPHMDPRFASGFALRMGLIPSGEMQDRPAETAPLAA